MDLSIQYEAAQRATVLHIYLIWVHTSLYLRRHERAYEKSASSDINLVVASKLLPSKVVIYLYLYLPSYTFVDKNTISSSRLAPRED